MPYELVDKEIELGTLRIGKAGHESVIASGTWLCNKCDIGSVMSLFGLVEDDDACFEILTTRLKYHYHKEHKLQEGTQWLRKLLRRIR